MSNKYSPRSFPSFTRADDPEQPSTTITSLHSDFVSHLQNSAKYSNKSLYDDINAILGNTKPKFSSVEEAVKDLKERTGLDKVMNARQIVASIQEPDLFKSVPELKVFIDNFITDRPGTSVESVIHDLLKIDSIKNKLPSSFDVPDDIKQYINNKIADVNKQNTDFNKVDMHIGKVDNSPSSDISNDPLSMCEPTKV